MVDNTVLNTGTGGDTIATDDIAGIKHQRVKIEYGVDGAATDVSDTNPLPVDDAGGSLTVDAAALDNAHSADFDTGAGTDTTTAFGIAVPASGGAVVVPGDATAGLKVDLGADNDVTNTTLSVTGGGVEASALRVTLASDSTGVVSVDDGAGSLTVDNAGTFAVQVDAALPAGTNAIGKLAANSGVDIGDVDILSVVPGSGATNLGKAEDAAHSTGDVGVMALAVRRAADTPTSGLDGDYEPLKTDANGHLKVEVFDGGQSHTVDNAGTFAVQVDAALPAGTNAIGKLAANSGVDIGDVDVLSLPGVAAEATALGSGVLIQGDDGTDRKNINVDATTGDVQVDVTNTVTVDATTSGDVPITLAGEAVVLGAGTAAVGKLAANSGVDIGDVDVTSISAGANLIGDVGIGVRTSGGTTLYKNLDVDQTEDQIKATAGQIYWIHAINLTAAVLYLKFYNATAANVTVGTTVPDLTFPLPTQGTTDGAGFTLSVPNGIAFGTAITVAATTGIADNDSGAPAANAVVVNLGYN